MARLTSRFLVDLLLRRAAAEGGFASVLAHGDDHGGAILVQCADRGRPGPLLEKRTGLDGKAEWVELAIPVAPSAEDGDVPPERAQERAVHAYCTRRRKSDPDLWLIELDIPNAPQLVAQWSALT